MGVTVVTTKPGTGVKPTKGDHVRIHYTGYLRKADSSKPDEWVKGNKFDSSIDRRTPIDVKIGVGSVIEGWDKGVVQMRVGEEATLQITSDYGYGKTGFPGAIPRDADLIFDVHLVKIIDPSGAASDDSDGGADEEEAPHDDSHEPPPAGVPP